MSMKTRVALDLIAAERARQIWEEGYSPEHDDEHDDQDLARAASCYAAIDRHPMLSNGIPGEWPSSWRWKPGPTRIRELVKAGALIAAEIDRLLRRGEKP